MIFPPLLVWGVSILWHSGSLKYNAEAGFMEEWLLTKAHRPFFSSPAAFTPVHFCSLSITTISFSLQTFATEPNSRFDYLLLGWTYCVGRHTDSSISALEFLQNICGVFCLAWLCFALFCFSFIHLFIHSLYGKYQRIFCSFVQLFLKS